MLLIVGFVRMKGDERRCQGYTIGPAVRVDMHTKKMKGKIVAKV